MPWPWFKAAKVPTDCWECLREFSCSPILVWLNAAGGNSLIFSFIQCTLIYETWQTSDSENMIVKISNILNRMQFALFTFKIIKEKGVGICSTHNLSLISAWKHFPGKVTINASGQENSAIPQRQHHRNEDCWPYFAYILHRFPLRR